MYPRTADGLGESFDTRFACAGDRVRKVFCCLWEQEGAQKAFLGKREGIKASIYIQNACGRVRVCV